MHGRVSVGGHCGRGPSYTGRGSTRATADGDSSERAGDCEAYVRLRIGGVRESEQKWRVRACATTVVAA